MEFPDPKYREVCSSETLRSSKQGFFSEFSSTVVNRIGRKWINDVFAHQKLEEDKIRICCTDSRVWTVIQEILQNIKPVYRKKSAAASRESRLEGEKLYKEKNFKKSTMLFTQSIIRAPNLGVDCSIDNGLSLSLAHNCRANVLHQLQLYKECLVDLHLSIKEGIPNEVRYEIYRKMGECHAKLNDMKRAKVALQVALKMTEDQISKAEKASRKLSKGRDDEHVSYLKREKEDIQKMLLKFCNGKNFENELKFPVDSFVSPAVPEIVEVGNRKYPNASKFISIKQNAEAGRFAVAADNISAGDTLVVETPYASCLIPEMYSSHCHHCYSRLNHALPCSVCSGVAFCSIDCRDAAISTYHKYECQFMGLFIGSGMSVLSFLSLRMVTQESISFFKNLRKKIQALTEDKEKANMFSEKEMSYMSVYNLVSHSDMRMNEDYFERALMAIFLVKCLKKTDFFCNGGDDREELSEDEILTASVILHHLQVLQFNAHEIYETKVEKPGRTLGSKSVYVAVGVYPTVALFNHECSPAVTRYFSGKYIVIKAVRPVKKGEIVSENYGPFFTKRTFSERIRELTSRYWFKCECDACTEDWPKMEYLSREHFRLRCKTTDCTGLLRYPMTMEKSHIQPRCQKCFNKIDLRIILQRVSQIESLFHSGIKHMENENCSMAVPLLVTYLNEIFKLGVPPCKEISLCQEALRTCYAQTGNLWVND